MKLLAAFFFFFFLLAVGTADDAFIHERELGIDIFEMQIATSFSHEELYMFNAWICKIQVCTTEVLETRRDLEVRRRGVHRHFSLIHAIANSTSLAISEL